ncbi:MAG: hypothetical protein ACI9OO_001856, partial [Bacteroidia bacterium]
MESIIVFLGQQWMLVGALLSCVLLLVFHDSKRSGEAVSPQAAVNLINHQDAGGVDLRDAKEYK